MILRRRRARPEILFDPEPDADSDTITVAVGESSPNPEEFYDRHQRRPEVLRAIRKLDPTLREPIHMQMTQGSSVREIGRALDISQAAVKSRLHRARLRLSAMHNLKPFAAYRHDSFSKSEALSPAFD